MVRSQKREPLFCSPPLAYMGHCLDATEIDGNCSGSHVPEKNEKLVEYLEYLLELLFFPSKSTGHKEKSC